jgi:hypothetical protein
MTPDLYFEGEFPALRKKLGDYLAGIGREADGLPGWKTILLAGGYGRGEGGVYLPPGGGEPTLYNDLEFYVVAENSPGEALARWTHRGEECLGIEIEWKALPPRALEKAEPSMFFYDLLSRHVLVAGDVDWVEALPGRLRAATDIPMVEASRLLVNRGMSLLRCRRWAAGELDLPPDFCARIVAKLKLALADAVLCAHGLYHWSCRERSRRLREVGGRNVPPQWSQLVAWHAEGVAFKLRPHFPGRTMEEWQELVREMITAWLSTFLWLEGLRLGFAPGSSGDYLHRRGRFFPEEAGWKNLLRQLRDRGRDRGIPWTGWDHPRSLVWKGLVGLLAAKEVPPIARALGLPGEAAAPQVEIRLRSLWQHYP